MSWLCVREDGGGVVVGGGATLSVCDVVVGAEVLEGDRRVPPKP